jgi:hypothetical protein
MFYVHSVDWFHCWDVAGKFQREPLRHAAGGRYLSGLQERLHPFVSIGVGGLFPCAPLEVRPVG